MAQVMQSASLDSSIYDLWRAFAQAQTLLKERLGRSANILGEIAELTVAKAHDGVLLIASSESADVKLDDGQRIQVKARTPPQTTTTQLSVIRSWDFDILAVLLFEENGSLLFAGEMKAEDAKAFAVPNKHQNGWVITTTQNFISSAKMKNVTSLYSKTLESL